MLPVLSYLTDLPPEERSMRARLAAFEKHAKTDGREATAAARAASPASDDYWLDKVDPGGDLEPKERAKRARSAKSAHYTRMVLARKKKSAGGSR